MTAVLPVVLSERLLGASLGGAVAVGLLWIVLRLVPRIPARARCWLWWLASAKFLLLLLLGPVVSLPLLPEDSAGVRSSHGERDPVVELRVPSGSPAETPGPRKANAVAAEVEKALSPPPDPPSPSLPVPWLLTLFWSVGAAAFLLNLGVGAVRERRRAASLPVVEDPDLLRIFTELRRHLGAGPCELRRDEGGEAPMVVGLWKPTVVLPGGIEELSRDRVRLLLAHELLHLRREDLWLGLVPAVVQTLFFFHPFVHLAVREYRLARETACDAAVLDRLRPDPRDYGRLLLELGTTTRPLPVAAGAVASRGHLYRRLTMLETHDPRRRWLPLLLLLPLLAVALAPVELVARESPTPAEEDPPVNDAYVASEPIRASAAVAPAPVDRASSGPAVAASAPVPVPPDEESSTARKTVVQSEESTVTSTSGSGGFSYSLSDRSSGEAFVLLLEDHSFFHGGAEDAEAARRQRRGREEILWYRSGDGEEWVIRDPEWIEAAEELYAPVRDLGRRQAELGRRQAELGARQSALGSRQAELGKRQAVLGKQQAELAARIKELTARSLELEARKLRGDWTETLAEERRELERRRRGLDERMRSLGASQGSLGSDQGDLGSRQSALGERQSALGAEQAALGAAQREASERVERELRRLVEEAIAAGDAESRN